MTRIHYKLPIDTEVDKDIHDWINSFHRTKKGEMVRHAIRYYMSILEEGETIVFPEAKKANTKEPSAETQQEKNRSERVRPKLNMQAFK